MNRTLLSNPRVVQSFGNIAADLESVMDRFFGDRSNGSDGVSFAPRMDISEGDDAYEVTVDLPGVKAEDVQIELKEGHLTISGSRQSVREEQKRQFHRIERASGAFSRTVLLPQGIDQDKVEASCADGVLTVRLPKAEANQPRRIRVKTATPTATGSVVQDRSSASPHDAVTKAAATQSTATQSTATQSTAKPKKNESA